MQFLINALPGFRDVRAPLVGGYLWLVFGWLVIRPDLDAKPHERLLAALLDLCDRVGPVTMALALSVAAYLVGAISEELAGWVVGWVFVGMGASRSVLSKDLQRRIQEIVRQAETLIHARTDLAESERSQMDWSLRVRLGEAEQELREELKLPATLLVGQRSELFAHVDRLRAESELRVSVALPLIALAGLLVVTESAAYGLVVPLVLLLARQGVRRQLEGRKVIADAITVGRIDSPSLVRFAAWKDDLAAPELDAPPGPAVGAAVP
jgi:hypothetical protein